jgi:CheY-like chemotaxis protein
VSGQPDILVVENDADFRTLIAEVLRAAGARVWSASDGLEALALCASRPFHLIITDQRMPRVCGIELVSRLRRVRRSWPILILTASPRDLDGVRDQLDGVTTLSKPVDLRVLVQTAHALLGAQAGQDGLPGRRVGDR